MILEITKPQLFSSYRLYFQMQMIPPTDIVYQNDEGEENERYHKEVTDVAEDFMRVIHKFLKRHSSRYGISWLF